MVEIPFRFLIILANNSNKNGFKNTNDWYGFGATELGAGHDEKKLKSSMNLIIICFYKSIIQLKCLDLVSFRGTSWDDISMQFLTRSNMANQKLFGLDIRQFEYNVMQSDRNSLYVVLDSFNEIFRNEDNIVDQIYKRKCGQIIIMMILMIYNIILNNSTKTQFYELLVVMYCIYSNKHIHQSL